MNAVKKQILDAVSVMNESDAERVWHFIEHNFFERSWEDIEESEPDEWDKKLLKEVSDNILCRIFLSSLYTMIGLELWERRPSRRNL